MPKIVYLLMNESGDEERPAWQRPFSERWRVFETLQALIAAAHELGWERPEEDFLPAGINPKVGVVSVFMGGSVKLEIIAVPVEDA